MGARTKIQNVSEELITNIEYNKPTYIVTVEKNEASQTLNGTGEWYSNTPVLVNYVHENYHVEKIFGNSPHSWPEGEIHIWRINTES